MQAKEKGAVAAGVRYITTDMIQKVTKQNNIDLITSLNLTLSREGGKKIKYIENLEKLKKLQTLNLSCNVIEKMEKLDKLTKLKELNISYNALSRIEGIDMLVNLQLLNVTGNMIEHIPAWLPKKLKGLRVFRIAKNNIQSLSELSKLRPLKDLSQLSVAENPVCQLSHSRLFLIFHLRTVETLDGQPIDWNERTTAQARFAQEEIEHLEQELEQRDTTIAQLTHEHNTSLQDAATQHKQQVDVAQRRKHENEHQKEMQRELETKNEMLKKRTSELTRACEKHYQLEQELAFYKIDHKFETLGQLPTPESGSQTDEDPYDESPYIGKGRFRKNEFARERMHAGHAQTAQAGVMQQASQQLHSELDAELEDKKNAIHAAQDRLSRLQAELTQTEAHMVRATEEMQRLTDNHPASGALSEDDKLQLRASLERKIDHVHLLRDEADKIEDDMAEAEREIQNQEQDIGRLRGHLNSMGSRDSLYSAVSKEVADKEMQLLQSNQAYTGLQRKLEEMLATIARETNTLKQLEGELREGQAAHNDELREELEGIVNGLQDYLADVQRRTDNQRQDTDRLVREREELLAHINNLEQDAGRLPQTEAELSHMYEKVTALEDTLAGQRDLNESLARQLNETQQHEDEDAELSGRLHDAEGLLGKLRQELLAKEAKAKAEREAYEKRLQTEQRRAAQLAEQARDGANKDDEINNLHRQLADLQNANRDLQDEMYKNKEDERNQKPELTADDLKRRLDDIYHALKAGKAPSTRNKQDPIDRPLGDFHRKVAQELDKSLRDLDRAKKASSKAEMEVQTLRDKMADRDNRRKAEIAVQTRLEADRHDLTQLQDELERLRDELEHEKNKQPLPFRLLEPTLRAHSTQVTSTESEAESESTIPSSQWSERKHELYDGMTPDEQELFDELQAEIEELRRLLARKDADASSRYSDDSVESKVADAQKKAQQLRDLINTRKSRQGPPPRSTRSVKPSEDARLRQAAEDLARAQDEIDGLNGVLKQTERALRHKTDNADRSQMTIAGQDKEINDLQDVLEDQRAEIIKLNRTMDDIRAQPAGERQVYDTAVQALRQGAAHVRSNLAQQSTRFHNLGDPHHTYPPQHGPPESHHPMGPDPYSSQRQFDAPVYSQQQPVQRGLPVPQMYGPPPQPGIPESHHHPHPANAAPMPQGAVYMPAPPPPPPPQMYQHQVAPTQGGMVYAPAGHQPVMQAPMTPVRSQPMQSNVQYMLATPTTPVAGPGMGVMMMDPVTPPVTGTSHPVMVSTPIHSAVHEADPVRGILKTGKVVTTEEGLVCNVPEHHDLEDYRYITKLQAKLKAQKLNAKSRGNETDVEIRKVIFEDDVTERQAIKRLKVELQERRKEMEALDLAIERQKTSLHKMKDAERTLVIQRSAAKRQLQELREGKEGRRKAFLDNDLYYELIESDFDKGDVDPLSKAGRKPFVTDEIDCLEETLARRRAELREADILITEAEDDLEDLRSQACGIITEYKDAKNNFAHVVQDAEEMEKRAHDTGVGLLKAQEEKDTLEVEVAELQQEKVIQEEMIKEILKIIGVKDAEFQQLETKLKDVKTSLAATQNELTDTEAEQRERLQQITDSDVVMGNRHKDLDGINQKVISQRKELEKLDREMGSKTTENDTITHALEKRRRQLSDLSQQVEQELAIKRREMKAVEDATSALKEDWSTLDRELKEKKSRLSEVDIRLDHEETVLQNLAATTNKQKTELADITEYKDRIEVDLDKARIACVKFKAELEVLREESGEMKRIRSEISEKKVDLESLKDKVDRQQEELESLTSQRRAMELAINNLRKEKLKLEDSHKLIERRTTQLQRAQGQAEDEIKTFHTQALSLERELRELEADIQDARREKTAVKQQVASLRSHLQDGQQELEQVKSQLNDTESQVELLTQDIKVMVRKKSETQEELSRLNDTIKVTEDVRAAMTRQRETEAAQLQNLSHHLKEQETEYRKITDALERLRSQVGDEESRLTKCLGEGRAELDQVTTQTDIVRDELSSALAEVAVLKREAERRRLTEEKFGNLERKIQELVQEITVTNDEKEQLTAALQRSSEELKSLRANMNKEQEEVRHRIPRLEGERNKLAKRLSEYKEELQAYREKSAAEIADLEAIAQAHYSRANRLTDELNYLRAEHLEQGRRLQHQDRAMDQGHRLEDTLQQLKSDIKAEVSGGMLDLSRNQMEAVQELGHLYEQKEDIEGQLNHLKHNLKSIRNHPDKLAEIEVPPVKTPSVVFSFAEQQDMLKKQLQQNMNQHEEAILTKRLASQDHIRDLQVKLTSLERALSTRFIPSADLPPAPLHDQHPTRDVTIEVTEGQRSKDLVTEPSSPKHAYSPNRHSLRRQRSRSPSPSASRGQHSPAASPTRGFQHAPSHFPTREQHQQPPPGSETRGQHIENETVESVPFTNEYHFVAQDPSSSGYHSEIPLNETTSDSTKPPLPPQPRTPSPAPRQGGSPQRSPSPRRRSTSPRIPQPIPSQRSSSPQKPSPPRRLHKPAAGRRKSDPSDRSPPRSKLPMAKPT